MRLVIIKPIITEVSMKDAGRGQFTFQVLHNATKTDIRSAVEKGYGVNVTAVTTVSITRRKTINTRIGRRKTKEEIKKARVTLKKGQMIPAFEVKEEKKAKKEVKKEEK